MPVTSRNKLYVAVVAVTLLAAWGLWSGLAKNDARDPGSSPSAVASPTDGADQEEAGPTTDAEPGSQGRQSRDRKDRDDRTQERSGERSGDGERGRDEADEVDEADEESGDETSVTLGTGETVPVTPVATESAVPLDEVGDFGTGLTVRLSEVTAEQAEASAPGEIAGPAVRVTVDAVNAGGKPISLDGVVVFVSYGEDRAPASQFGSLSDPLAGDLAGDSRRTGSYVYAVPAEGRADLRVEISYTGTAPTVAFEGSVDG